MCQFIFTSIKYILIHQRCCHCSKTPSMISSDHSCEGFLLHGALESDFGSSDILYINYINCLTDSMYQLVFTCIINNF